MKKIQFTSFLSLILILGIAGLAGAESFLVSAEVPSATGITYKVTEILGSIDDEEEDEWTENHPADLNFGMLKLDTENNIFLPVRYFAIDIGVAGEGAGKPHNIQFSYSDSASHPNQLEGNGRGGLGKKATLQMTRATLEPKDYEVGDQSLLINVAALGTFSKTQFLDGWPRVYVGIYDGSDEDKNEDGWEVFTADDAPGVYSGTLTITAVVN